MAETLKCPHCGSEFPARTPGATFEVTGWTGTPLGLRFGNENRRLFVDPCWSDLHLDLDGEVRLVPIGEAFWRKCPEIRSHAIEAWLKRHRLHPWPPGQPPRIRIEYLGQDYFRALLP